MTLRIHTPIQTVVDCTEVTAVRAEDAGGSFGILPGHEDFLTALNICVVAWSDGAGRRRFCAVRYGMLTVSGGHSVQIATRDAVAGDDLDDLEHVVLRSFDAAHAAEAAARVESLRLQLQATRHLVHYLRPGSGQGAAV
jgi:F-type H+-transporting ATPase subunit epsilon